MQRPPQQNMPKFNLNWVYAIIIGVLLVLFFTGGGGTGVDKNVSYSVFTQYLSKGYAHRLEVNKSDGTLKMFVEGKHIQDVFHETSKETGKNPTVSTTYGSLDKLQERLDAETKAGHFKGTVTYVQDSNMMWNIILNILPILLFIGLWLYFMRRMGSGGGNGGVFSVGKSKAQLFEKQQGKQHVTFKDVAGQEGAKREVQEIVDFLKNPKKYTDLGGKIPRGALLVGPPGTGKTLLAKAVAGEADVPFFSISGSDFVEMFVGVGASRVRDLFRQAKEKAPSIIFIDEIDAVGRARGKNPSMGGNDERENTLNQLLTEMDGFSPNSGVIVLAATNRVDILDKALLRAGRFDRQIHVDLPDLGERKAIFLVHMRPLKMDNTVDVDLMARQTPGFSGADIANVCNEAALIAARHNKKSIGMQDFLDAVDRIIGGLEKKTKVMTREEKHTIALHEAGHATISWFLRYANPLVKVSIVPRGQALGAAWYLPEERNITTKEQMEDEICATLGGRAAEELFTGHISTGALNDLETVTKRAYGMVAYLGMSEKLYNLCYYNNQEYQFEKPYSEKTAETIDSEVAALINRQYERAKELLMVHKEGHAQLAALLEEKEVIFAKDVENIFGKRPWASRADEILQEDNDIIEKNVAARIREDAGQKDNNDGAEDKPQDGTPSDADATPADNNTTSSGSDTTSPAPQGETTTTSAPAEEKNSPAAQDDK
jgi:cell division protease FtsH